MVYAKIDDQLRVRYAASASPLQFFGDITVQDKDGGVQFYEIPAFTSFVTNRGTAAVDGERIRTAAGKVIACTMSGSFGGINRGQFYAAMYLVRSGVAQLVTKGYIYAENPVILGEDVELGPGGGNGFIHKNAIADDVTPVDIEHTLGVSNALRRIDGFIWYYHASSDVATRTLRVSARDFGEGLPTGMTSGGNTLQQLWPSAGTLDLTANQEGMIYVSAQNGSRIAVSLDNGVRVIEDTSVAQPLPFPYWANEDDVGELFFDVVDAEALDRHSIYIIEEEWIQP